MVPAFCQALKSQLKFGTGKMSVFFSDRKKMLSQRNFCHGGKGKSACIIHSLFTRKTFNLVLTLPLRCNLLFLKANL